MILSYDKEKGRPTAVIYTMARLVMGVLFAFHGAATLFGIFGKHAAHFGVWPSWWAALIELLGGLLVAVGFGTRIAAVLSSGAMAYAYFTVHQPHALLPMVNGGEPAALYCWIFLLIAAIGAGPISLDALLRRGRGDGVAIVEKPMVADSVG